MRVRLFRTLLFVLLLAWLPDSAIADRILLNSGRSIDGIVVKETAAGVVLDIGAGTTTIASNKIASVQKSNEAGNDQITKQWKDQYFLLKKNVPEGLEGVADEFRQLLNYRADAIRMQQMFLKTRYDETRLLAEADDLSKRLTEVSRKMADAKPTTPKDYKTYNVLVVENNALGAKTNLKHTELDDIKKQRKDAENAISHYADLLTSFESSFENRAAKLREEPARPTDPSGAGGSARAEVIQFLDKIAARLKGFSQELTPFVVETTPSHGSKLVSAVVNDKVKGTFVLDTGASMVSFSKTFAERLKLDMRESKSADVTMADGRTVKGETVILGSVQMGDARIEKVQAVIIPTAGNDEVDGLLGMSFLRNFVIQLDGNTGKLILKQFNPK